jgi:hypothetical protein
VVLAVVVSPFVETVVVALVSADLVVTVFVDGLDFGAANAGVAMIARTATELINFLMHSSSFRHRYAGEVADIPEQVSEP